MEFAVIASPARQPEAAVGATDQRTRIPSMVVLRMAHQFDAELVFPKTEVIYIPDWYEVVELKCAAKSNAPDATGGLPASVKAPASATGFTIVRETASSFSGDWPRLKGKQALYLWARPEGSIPSMAAGKKLRFAEAIFLERYREASHSSRSSVEGIVVIFLDQRGGVAAASLEDIGHWADGSLSQTAFLKKCSLDPPGAFENADTTRGAALP